MAVDLVIAKWGNSLALRLPIEYARSLGVKEGDHVEASLTVDGSVTLRPVEWDRKRFADELGGIRATMSLGWSVMDEVRRSGRY